tara:strand:- start:106 stop:741 length:636 start_codon:yes stop_codon:yes gene_type:complete
MIRPIGSYIKLNRLARLYNIQLPNELRESSYPIVQYRTNGDDDGNNTNDQGAGNDDWISLSFQEGGTNYNEQVGFINANAQANLNVSVFDSGSGATVASLGAGATAAMGVLTVAAAAVAVIAAGVGVYQMFETAEKQRVYAQTIKLEQERLGQIQLDIYNATMEQKLEAEATKLQIDLKTEALDKNRTALLVSAGMLSIGILVLGYKLKTR